MPGAAADAISEGRSAAVVITDIEVESSLGAIA